MGRLKNASATQQEVKRLHSLQHVFDKFSSSGLTVEQPKVLWVLGDPICPSHRTNVDISHDA